MYSLFSLEILTAAAKTPQMAAHQAPPSLGFSRQEHCSGLPFPSPVCESEKWMWSCSVVSDSATPWTEAYQAPLSMGFSRQEYWSGVPLPPVKCREKPKLPIKVYKALHEWGFTTSLLITFPCASYNPGKMETFIIQWTYHVILNVILFLYTFLILEELHLTQHQKTKVYHHHHRSSKTYPKLLLSDSPHPQVPSMELNTQHCFQCILRICVCVCAKSFLLCLILCNTMDSSPPGSSAHGIFQASILEWVAMPSSRESSQPRDQTHIS